MPRLSPRVECLLIFGALPGLLALFKPHGWIYPFLWFLAALAWYSLHKDPGYRWRLDVNKSALNSDTLKFILKRFLPFAVALLTFTWIMIPERLFSLPRERPQVWVMVMILYPLLSVIPQEFIFRSFFFRRYESWLETPHKRMLASALAFGWVHIVLLNWVAVVFSAIGGLLFAHSYSRTKSLAVACFEHALYGCYIFTIGLGFYFYHGHAVR